MANKPTNPQLYSRVKSEAKKKFDRWPSAYGSAWLVKEYKRRGGGYRKAEDGMEIPGYDLMANGGMLYGDYQFPFMDEGGEMALGQIAAVTDKMSKLQQFLNPNSDIEPWIASKLAVMDHSADAIYDYMMYNPEAQESEGEYMEEMRDGGIPKRYKNQGFTRVGAKRQSTRPGKKWMVLAKKGDKYKVVHGGYKGMSDYTQHRNKNRQKRFWDRMGGRDSAKAKDPFSPLYWHKRFGTWAEGGEPQNEGFQALPEAVQAKIMANMMYGGDMYQFGGIFDNLKGVRDLVLGDTPEERMQTKKLALKALPMFLKDGGMPCYECGGQMKEGGTPKSPAIKSNNDPTMLDEIDVVGSKFKPKGLFKGIRSRFARNINPFGYEALSLRDEENGFLRDLKEKLSIVGRVANAVILDKPEKETAYDWPKEHLKERQALLDLSMGQPVRKGAIGALSTSEYKPSSSTDKDKYYLRSRATEKEIIDYLTNSDLVALNYDLKNNDGKIIPYGGTLGNYTLSLGKDDNGSYLSYYDLWDLNPADGVPGVRDLVDGAQSVMGVNPPEVYGRVYVDTDDEGNIIGIKTKKANNSKKSRNEMGNIGDDNMYAMGGTPFIAMAYFRNGGIKLDPAKKGTFKAMATRMGLSVQEAAKKILDAPEGTYSPEMRRKANFARNFAKEYGGSLRKYQGDVGSSEVGSGMYGVYQEDQKLRELADIYEQAANVAPQYSSAENYLGFQNYLQTGKGNFDIKPDYQYIDKENPPFGVFQKNVEATKKQFKKDEKPSKPGFSLATQAAYVTGLKALEALTRDNSAEKRYAASQTLTDAYAPVQRMNPFDWYGEYVTNQGDLLNPRQMTPVQYRGMDYPMYMEEGGQVVELDNEQIKQLLALGAEIEMLDE